MEVLRTPDERFNNLPGYDFRPHYVEVDSLRIHHVDVGSRDARVVLLMHGEPSWCFLYRKMICPLARAGFRVVAPDLVGFGRSDKPAAVADYSYQRHVDWMHAWLEQVDLREITLFCQDWGSLIGLRLAAEHDERFARVVLANGGLPTGDQPLPKAFHAWKAFALRSPWFPVGKIVAKGCRGKLEKRVVAAYDAPFPSRRYKAGARAFPALVPVGPDDPAAPANRTAWKVFERWEKPFLTAFSTGDPITRGGDVTWQTRVPGARGQPHTRIHGAGHFLQEDQGEALARVVIDFARAAG